MLVKRGMKELNALLSRKLIPYNVTFELTYQCNQRCIHCYQDTPVSAEILSLDEIECILEDLAHLGCYNITLTGGEALVRRDFLDIVRAMHRRSFGVTVLTNGVLVDSVMAREMAKAKVRDVQVSVYGSTAQVHDGITGLPGSFSKTLSGIDNLIEQGLHVTVKVLIMKYNFHERERIRAYWKEKDVAYREDAEIMDSLYGGRDTDAARMTDEQLDVYLHEKAKVGELHPNMNNRIGMCGAGTRVCGISAYGDVYPCISMQLNAGNVRQNSFASVWKTSPALAKLRAIKPEDFKVCGTCAFSKYCVSCPGRFYLRNRDVTRPIPEACRYIEKVTEAVYDVYGPSEGGDSREEGVRGSGNH